MATRIFKRKIYNDILKWKKERNGSTALLIEGARRVGKSTIVRAFAEAEYESYILVDFSNAPKDVIDSFDYVHNLNQLFLRLQTFYNVVLKERKSLIIFDEVQFCPRARQAIKHLVADGRYDYIETGSLVSIHRNVKDILIPSEEERLTMYPMDYEEYLWATGQVMTMEMIRDSFENLRPLGDSMHREMMRRFRQYMLIGGMPQAVNAYLDNNNFVAVDMAKRDILELYINDLRKLDSGGMMARVFSAIPGQLATGKLKFNISDIIPGVVTTRCGEIWQDLDESMTVNFCYRVSDPGVGMALSEVYKSFKIYLCDTGLFVTLAFRDNTFTNETVYSRLLSDKLDVSLGYIYENAVAQMLRASGHRLFYSTFPADGDGKKNYEVDFLVVDGAKVRPIEVKSSGYSSHRSLDVFCQKYSSRITRPVLLYTKDLRTDGQLLCLPVYMAPLL